MTKETQSSFTDDVWDIEQTGTMQNFIIGHEVVPTDLQDASLAVSTSKLPIEDITSGICLSSQIPWCYSKQGWVPKGEPLGLLE